MNRRFGTWILGLLAILAGTAPLAAADEAIDEARAIVERLAGPQSRGRAVDTDLDAAATWLEEQLAALGPVQRQPVEVDGSPSANLVLLRPPSVDGAGWIVVMAHYDHLGVGEAGGPHAGEVYFGADDNASGCAVLLMTARAFFEGPIPTDRGLAFVFSTGEESGLLGARRFVADGPVATDAIVAAINLDTVGRLDAGEFTVFGVGTARGFSRALDGLNTVFRLPLQAVQPSSGTADDMAFVEAEIPALHLFTGARPEYHRPGDTAEKIDYAGLVDLTDFTVELVDYLARADTPVDWVPTAAALADPERATEGRRRVSFGSIPDFEFQGEGVLLSGVLPGSPAAEAGLQAGDRITGFGGAPVVDLTGYSEAMKLYAPGDVVEVHFVRDGEERSVEVTLAERR